MKRDTQHNSRTLLCWLLLMLSVITYAECRLCRVLLMLSVILLEVRYTERQFTRSYENGATTLKITTLSYL
jgi:hypothetical protein